MSIIFKKKKKREDEYKFFKNLERILRPIIYPKDTREMNSD